MLPAPKPTQTHTGEPGLRVRHPVERDINSCANFKREGEREKERKSGREGRVESRYDSNRAVGKYFFGRKEPREKKETEGVVFCPWREKRRCALEDDFVALHSMCIRCFRDWECYIVARNFGNCEYFLFLIYRKKK